MSARGFTLVEVLVALIVVALGMGAVLASLTSAADTTAYLRERTFAEWVAMNRMAELRLQGRLPTVGESSGKVEFAGREWAWEQEVAKLDVPGTVRIDLSVRAQERGAGGSEIAAKLVGIVGDAIHPPDGRVLIWDQEPSGPGSAGGPRRAGSPNEQPEADSPDGEAPEATQ